MSEVFYPFIFFFHHLKGLHIRKSQPTDRPSTPRSCRPPRPGQCAQPGRVDWGKTAVHKSTPHFLLSNFYFQWILWIENQWRNLFNIFGDYYWIYIGKTRLLLVLYLYNTNQSLLHYISVNDIWTESYTPVIAMFKSIFISVTAFFDLYWRSKRETWYLLVCLVTLN